jgi:hypothetical protein
MSAILKTSMPAIEGRTFTMRCMMARDLMLQERAMEPLLREGNTFWRKNARPFDGGVVS